MLLLVTPRTDARFTESTGPGINGKTTPQGRKARISSKAFGSVEDTKYSTSPVA
jgi:hypothetical protein